MVLINYIYVQKGTDLTELVTLPGPHLVINHRNSKMHQSVLIRRLQQEGIKLLHYSQKKNPGPFIAKGHRDPKSLQIYLPQ